jgi:hypothetical protein
VTRRPTRWAGLGVWVATFALVLVAPCGGGTPERLVTSPRDGSIPTSLPEVTDEGGESEPEAESPTPVGELDGEPGPAGTDPADAGVSSPPPRAAPGGAAGRRAASSSGSAGAGGGGADSSPRSAGAPFGGAAGRDAAAPPTSGRPYCELAAAVLGDLPERARGESDEVVARRYRQRYVVEGASAAAEVEAVAPSAVRGDISLVVATLRRIAESGDTGLLRNREFLAAKDRVDAFNERECPAQFPGEDE